jgi:hypothetical protein
MAEDEWPRVSQAHAETLAVIAAAYAKLWESVKDRE